MTAKPPVVGYPGWSQGEGAGGRGGAGSGEEAGSGVGQGQGRGQWGGLRGHVGSVISVRGGVRERGGCVRCMVGSGRGSVGDIRGEERCGVRERGQTWGQGRGFKGRVRGWDQGSGRWARGRVRARARRWFRD